MINCYVSKKTLNELDTLLQNYKKNIINDIVKRFNVDYKNKIALNKLIERKKIFLKRKQKSNIDSECCMAKIWDKREFYYHQCYNKQKIDNYCNLHKLDKNRHYGDVI